MEVPINAGVCNTSGDTVAFFQQVTHGVLHEDVNTFVDTTLLQCSDEFETRGVTNVSKPWEGVATKVSLIDEVVWGSIEHCAPLLEFTNSVWSFLGVEFSHAPISQPLASFHGVMEVHLPAISWVCVLQGCCATSFGHDRVCFSKQGFRDDCGFCSASCSFNCCS